MGRGQSKKKSLTESCVCTQKVFCENCVEKVLREISCVGDVAMANMPLSTQPGRKKFVDEKYKKHNALNRRKFFGPLTAKDSIAPDTTGKTFARSASSGKTKEG